ncbi:MAG: hypothetical protein ACE15C_00345 [Phycisphaerae bacterium]
MSEDILSSPDEEPISLVGEPEVAEGPAPAGGVGIKPKAVRTFGTGAAKLDQKLEHKRQVNVTGAGATRCRVFYSKIAVAPLQHLEHQINEWLDATNFEVKHIAQTIGVMEGKTPEPNLIVTVWY